MASFWSRAAWLTATWEPEAVKAAEGRTFSFISVAAVSLPLYPAYALVYALLGVYRPIIALSAFGLGVALSLLMVRWARRLEPAVHLYCGCTLGALFCVSFYTGGVASPALYWSVIVPPAALALLSVRESWIWVGATLVHAWIQFEVSRRGLHPAGALKGSSLDVIHALSVAGLVGLNVVCVSAMLRSKAKDLENAQAASREIEAARRAAVRASEAKSRFLANMSHEIRTPMNGIVGMTELLSLTHLDHDQAEMAQTIRTSSAALLDVINDVLDLSKIEADRLELESAPFSLPLMVESVGRLMEVAAKQSDIVLDVHLDREAQQTVLGDATRLRQVLLNLVSNAIKFTSRGQVQLRVTRDARGAFRFEVEDTGIGIAPEALASLFDPFVQADGSTTRRFGGTGLGLSICHRLVGLMSGELQVESELDRGSRFWFAVPLECTSEESVREPESHSVALGLRVLLVEDNAVNRKVAERMLLKLGCVTDTAEHGARAVELANAHTYDVILMDCNMPTMDGFEATKLIIARSPSPPPIIALTASSLAQERNRCLEVGMADFLSKPIQLDRLRRGLLAASQEARSVPTDGSLLVNVEDGDAGPRV